MEQVFPDYYKEFKCIGGTCGHNCCIGWEIDIDEETAEFYETVSGEMGKRLRENISGEDVPHFILGQNERCPFLNEQNLCDIILTMGESCICEICTEHPRFHNEFPGRIESGVGLCCEEAGRLILGKKDPVVLEVDEDTETADTETADEYILFRDEMISILQDRSINIERRIRKMLESCDSSLPEKRMEEWVQFLLELERLDESWTEILELLQEKWKKADVAGFDIHMSARQTEYEQFLVYLVYRHLANAVSEVDLAARAAFAAFGYMMIHAMGAVIWTEAGVFDFDQQVELARLFSSELEYSEDNLDRLLDEMVME